MTTTTTSRPASVWRDYAGAADHFDEAVDAGGVRPAWAALAQKMDEAGPGEINERWALAQRTIQDNGVSYNIHHEDDAASRMWKLDPIPLVIDDEQWRAIEAGIAQRATLLDRILGDLYGEQALITGGAIPPELLLANPGYLRPVHGVAPPGGQRLISYAADLGRSRDGRWWVIADRTQAPSGAGYALENRIVTARVWPQAFREGHVRRLAGYFSVFRDTLRRLTPQHKDDPSIVMLTPGALAETYFEHAYLARYLGLPLVEGRDLTVRRDRVYLKTLSGLHPVDVIIRRVDDDYCDPLELRDDSALGVTGLVRAVRAGHVVLANALGAGVIEAPGMLPFLPGLCRRLLGEDEKLPSVATWWCGQAAERSYVLEHLERMVIKPALRGELMEPVFGAELSAAQRSELVAKIEARPHLYVGQEWLPLSSAPVWSEDGGLRPRLVMMRVFATADGEGGYRVMPGGMTRVASWAGSRVVSMQRGGGSKDTWVTSSEPTDRTSLLPPPGVPVALVRGGVDMPSRQAEDLFWLGRYLERISGLVHLLRAIVRRTYEDNDVDLDDTAALHNALVKLTATGAPDRVIKDAIGSADAPFGLIWNARNARRLGGSVRDVVSDDMWRVITRLEREVTAAAAVTDDPVLVLERLDGMMLTVAGLIGLSHDGMTRGHGYWFLEMGRRIEAVLTLTAVISTLLEPDAPPSRLTTLLQVCDSIKTYRSRYRTLVAPAPVCDLLVLDETNPRSVAFALAEVSRHIDQLPREPGRAALDDEQRAMLSMLTRVRLAGVDELTRPGALPAMLDALAADTAALADLLTRHYLAHAQPPSTPGSAGVPARARLGAPPPPPEADA
jgi:uncharacterized circularly permuted ATP-grasp superfamily protein/uncharacterized alpha-E superfamily protein